MRSVLCIAAILLYSVLFNIYAYELPKADGLTLRECKLLYNYISLGMVVFYVLDRRGEFESYWHEQFNLICILCVIINYIIIILVHHVIITDFTKIAWIFNGAVGVTSAFVVFSGIRHGVFKD